MFCRWRILRRPIIAEPSKVVVYVQAAVALHNYLRTTESSLYCPPGFVDGEDGEGSPISGSWRSDQEPCVGMQPISHTSSNRCDMFNIDVIFGFTIVFYNYRHSRSAADNRDLFRSYFNSPAGEVQWQYAHVRRTS